MPIIASILHDVGKIGVPDVIINKEGKLTGDQVALTNIRIGSMV